MAESIFEISRRMREQEKEHMTACDFIEGFVKGTLGRKTKHDRWSVIWWGNMDVLQYTHPDDPENPERFAYKMQDGSVISNANQLTYIGRRYAWGHEVNRYDRTRVEEQEWIEEAGAIPIPFTLFREADMDVRDFSWVVKPVAENVSVRLPPQWNEKVGKFETRHFSGACIFAIGQNMYLFDIDRQEIAEHNIFNPFVTKLPRSVSSIKEAYDILMPDEVRKAIENGIDVKRQGEFFFIRVSDECPVKSTLTEDEVRTLRNPPSRIGYGLSPVNGRFSLLSDDRAPFEKDFPLDTPERKAYQEAALEYKRVFEKYSNVSAKAGTLGKSASGSHSVEQYVEKNKIPYVSGKISQNRRQHGDLTLIGWYKVVANTGTISWTITGDID